MRIFIILLVFLHLQSCAQNTTQQKETDMNKTFKVQKSEKDWQKELSPEEYYVLREKGTERPGSGQYNLHFEEGTYRCNACGEPLFDSDSKFEAHCGWPSFDEAIEGKILYQEDRSHGMIRTEILCATCGSHLGHVFDDGPTETGKRFCVNSISLDFEEEKDQP